MMNECEDVSQKTNTHDNNAKGNVNRTDNCQNSNSSNIDDNCENNIKIDNDNDDIDNDDVNCINNINTHTIKNDKSMNTNFNNEQDDDEDDDSDVVFDEKVVQKYKSKYLIEHYLYHLSNTHTILTYAEGDEIWDEGEVRDKIDKGN